MAADNILSHTHWVTTDAFTTMEEKETQMTYYKANNAAPGVLKLVELDSKPFGSVCEKIISELFNLGPRTSSENDGTLNGKKIEIKTARYWGGQDECVWQHFEPDHDYEYALFVLLGFHGFEVWGIKKSDLMSAELRNVDRVARSNKPVNFQGAQGWWTKKSAIVAHATPIKTIEDLQALVQ